METNSKKGKFGNAFPPEDVLKAMREKLSDPNYQGSNIAPPKSASKAERLKYDLSQMIARYRHEHNLLQKELAEKLGIDESRISEILRGKLEDFSLERLMGYVEVLYPHVRIGIDPAA